MTSTSEYGWRRRSLLETLAGQLPERGLASRMIGGEEPVLWIWHPRTRKQTIVFASPAKEGWVFLWSPDGQENADEPGLAADRIRKLLSQPV
ncbi:MULTISPECIES: hypothetical protein [Sphaerimonospora]|uniref:Uncharacterized protein n=2 Tax=Sphaerimonospora TaxID=1792303 RepID=A0A8J3R3Z9_9ACTN|nr:hypothetical protein [Sphaerimonospora thailandensis]GIH68692.1 hypothetical protein Mth01_09450 [Sphaerimonospora thailandensis]